MEFHPLASSPLLAHSDQLLDLRRLLVRQYQAIGRRQVHGLKLLRVHARHSGDSGLYPDIQARPTHTLA